MQGSNSNKESLTNVVLTNVGPVRQGTGTKAGSLNTQVVAVGVGTNASPTEEKKRRRTFPEWLKKYFLEGQSLHKSYERSLEQLSNDLPAWKRILITKRRLIGLVIPAVVFHFFWWAYFIKFNPWGLFVDKYFMSITMIFGSMIAGMTSEGGGAVAFPVMTLAFQISPSVARDFSLMIQSTGMTAAAFTLFWMKVKVEWRAVIFCTIGGLIGMIIGLEFLDPLMTPPQKKMGFVSVWFSFAFALFLLNRYHKRKTFKTIPQFKLWKAAVLLVTGICGGIFSSIAGSGVDICSFSILTLLFRVTEKTATPTSVILMGINTVIGFYWRAVMMNAVEQVTWEYMAVCIPIVVIGAPLGTIIGTHFHRLVLAGLIYVLDTVALVSAFAIVKLSDILIGVSVGIIVLGFLFFFAITKIGERMMYKIVEDEEISLPTSESEVTPSVVTGDVTNGGTSYANDGYKAE